MMLRVTRGKYSHLIEKYGYCYGYDHLWIEERMPMGGRKELPVCGGLPEMSGGEGEREGCDLHPMKVVKFLWTELRSACIRESHMSSHRLAPTSISMAISSQILSCR